MKCLMRYGWVKLMRSHLPKGKGILGMWARLASHVAFRKGIASYCGYENEVVPGMWSGGIVGVKSILGIRSRKKAFETLDTLSELGYIRYTLDGKTKKLTYIIQAIICIITVNMLYSYCTNGRCANERKSYQLSNAFKVYLAAMPQNNAYTTVFITHSK